MSAGRSGAVGRNAGPPWKCMAHEIETYLDAKYSCVAGISRTHMRTTESDSLGSGVPSTSLVD